LDDDTDGDVIENKKIVSNINMFSLHSKPSAVMTESRYVSTTASHLLSQEVIL
jgi:hypothetical protein